MDSIANDASVQVRVNRYMTNIHKPDTIDALFLARRSLGGTMKRIAVLIIAVGMSGGLVFMAAVFGQAEEEAWPHYGVKKPTGYPDSTLCCAATISTSVTHVA